MKFRTYKDISRIANKFLSDHHSDLTVPIPVEEIVECSLKIHIVPRKNLLTDLSIDAYLTGDYSELHIDEDHYLGETTRSRFTLAHEIGHYVMHKESSRKFKNESEWKNYMLESQKIRRGYEYQANDFAGCLLLPQSLLVQDAKKFKTKSKTKKTVSAAFQAASFLKRTAKKYDVSEQATQIRISKLLEILD